MTRCTLEGLAVPLRHVAAQLCTAAARCPLELYSLERQYMAEDARRITARMRISRATVDIRLSKKFKPAGRASRGPSNRGADAAQSADSDATADQPGDPGGRRSPGPSAGSSAVASESVPSARPGPAGPSLCPLRASSPVMAYHLPHEYKKNAHF